MNAEHGLERKRIVHLTTGLGVGGAEQILFWIVTGLESPSQSHVVISLFDDGYFGSLLEKRNIRVLSVGLERSNGLGIVTLARNAKKILWLFRKIRKISPTLIQTWMYPADLVGGVIGRILSIPVIWGVFAGSTDRVLYRPLTYFTIRLCGLCSHFLPATIVSCSAFGRRSHFKIGYPLNRLYYIPTGFNRRQSTVIGKQNLCSTDAVAPCRVGMLGRISSEKRHDLLITAISLLVDDAVPVTLALAGGKGVDESNASLRNLIHRHNLEKIVTLKGRISDTKEFYENIDLFVLISRSEGLPTVIGEAMAYGLPCLVSNAGDAKILLNDSVQVLKDNSLETIRAGLHQLVKDRELRNSCGAANQTRIRNRFSRDTMLRRYGMLYDHFLK